MNQEKLKLSKITRTKLEPKGVIFKIYYQFFATDSTQHFLRAALYFETTPNEDSLAPIHQYLLKDMQHMVNTLRWK